MNRTYTLSALFTVTLVLQSSWLAAQEIDPREAFRGTMADPAFQKLRQLIKANPKFSRTVPEQRVITREVLVPCQVRCGLFGRRRKTVWMRRTTQQTITVQRVESLARIDWSEVDLATREYALKDVSLPNLPKATGAKAFFVRVLTENELLEPVGAEVDELQKKVLVQNIDFPLTAKGGLFIAYSCAIAIKGPQDEILDVRIAVAAKDAMGNDIDNDVTLKGLATALLTVLEKQFKLVPAPIGR